MELGVIWWFGIPSEVTCGVPLDNEAHRIFGVYLACPYLFKSPYLGLKDGMRACCDENYPETP